MIFWQNNIVAKQYFGKMIFWQNHYFGRMILWQKIFWQNHILGYTLAAFQTNTLFKANDFANWLTKEPQFEWQKNHFWSSPEKPQQEHHEANGPPRSPNHVLLSLILIYWYDCAVLFAAPRVVQDWGAFNHHGCRDAGKPPCMNMLWSHALPIQVFHVKTVQPRLNLRCFGHETMSVDLSIGLCCVISVIVCKFCGLRLAVPLPNKHNYPDGCTDTQYQPEKKHTHIPVVSIWLIVFILHSSPVFNLKQ